MHPCFLIEPAGNSRITVSAEWGECSKALYGGKRHYCTVTYREGPTDVLDALYHAQTFIGISFATRCDYCGEDGGTRSSSSSGLSEDWVRRDTGETHPHSRDFGIGAMYYATWYDYNLKDANGEKLYGVEWDNQTEPPLIVITPGGEWDIDSRASNCTRKDDRHHRCWIRHGQVPKITVNKSGDTCSAGAGSILCGTYHGFLRDGFLT